MNEKDFVNEHFGNQLRLRVCGICTRANELLLIRQKGIGPLGELWLPPGGGVEPGQSVPENLEREFLEETGLKVKTEQLLFVHEHLEEPLHAVELFFTVSILGGKLITGTDPELPADQQLIQEARYFNFSELKALDPRLLHAMLRHCNSIKELNNAKGYFKYGK